MAEIELTQLEMDRLMEIYKKFPTQRIYTLTQSHASGIGATTEVKINLFEEEPDTTINITDVSVW